MLAFTAPGWKLFPLAHNLAEKLGLVPQPTGVQKISRVYLDAAETGWVDSYGNEQYGAGLKEATPDNLARLNQALTDLGCTVDPF